MPAPATLSARRHAGLARQRRSGATSRTKAIMKSAPWTTNQPPRNRKATSLSAASASMNCGSRARKKIAIFGLRTLVRSPCRRAGPGRARRALAWRRRFIAAQPIAGIAAGRADAPARSMPIASHTQIGSARPLHERERRPPTPPAAPPTRTLRAACGLRSRRRCPAPRRCRRRRRGAASAPASNSMSTPGVALTTNDPRREQRTSRVRAESL